MSLLNEEKDVIQATIYRPHLMQMFPNLFAKMFNSMSSEKLEDHIVQSMALNLKKPGLSTMVTWVKEAWN